jgi:uncharacterized protein
MKIKIVLIALILLAPLSAPADERTDLAREIMELTHMNKMMDQVKAHVTQLQDQVLSQMEIPEGKKANVESYKKKIHDKIFEIMDYKKMQKEFIELYTTVYTLEELKGMVNFYKSDVGKSMIEKQPAVVKRSMEISQNKVRLLIPELQKITEDFEHSLKE